MARQEALDRIRSNIADFGYHVYGILAGSAPRFHYTIGLSRKLGSELVFAGGFFYMHSEVLRIIEVIATDTSRDSLESGALYDIRSLGSFTLRPVHDSWGREMLLGAYDLYGSAPIPTLQIVPDAAHWTIDVPDMAPPWSAATAPVWRWHFEPWSLPVPGSSEAVTNLAALRGEPVTEAARWEVDEWDLFAGPGPDVSEGDMRIVPLGTLLGADPSLEPVLSLPVGSALWRESRDEEWQAWIQARDTEPGRGNPA